jgi:DNA-binding MarR family transcriptional regulator
MPFDALIANAGRIRILAALAAEDVQDFVGLRQATRLTDGNLSSHARRLAGAGMIRIDKSFRDGKPVTTMTLTEQGRHRLTEHVRALVALIAEPSNSHAQVDATPEDHVAEEDWVD